VRIKHEKYGHGIMLEEFESGSGQEVARVIFDAQPGEERMILRSVLSESTAPLIAKAKPARKPAAKKKRAPEPVTDELLVDLAPVRAAQLDAVDVDELPEELKNAAEETAEDEAE
jgi:hypothetical protein